MNCPACSALLSADKERCPACGAVVAPHTDGALAPDLAKPPLSRRSERLHEGTFRKREPAWKDEVRERLRHRKKQAVTSGTELPLFPDASEQIAEVPISRPERYRGGDPAARDAVSPERRMTLEPAPYFERVPLTREVERPAAVETLGIEPQVGEAVLQRDVHREPLHSPDDALAGRSTGGLASLESQPEMADLPLHPELAAPGPAVEEPVAPTTGPRFLEADERESDDPVSKWSSDDEIAEPLSPAAPVERPALLVERLQAAALDVLAVGLAATFVVYFAARTARVPVLGLLPTWPYLAGFLAFFGLVYASFFTGLTGQTLGKMMFRLRVVDRAGAPPGHGRAALRALLGTAFSLALIGIAPIFLDPARRALHDRLLKTRVIHI